MYIFNYKMFHQEASVEIVNKYISVINFIIIVSADFKNTNKCWRGIMISSST